MAKAKCPSGRLKNPVRDGNGKLRTCKLKKKSKIGRKLDRKNKSKERHEIDYRKKKRKATKKKRR